MNRSNQNTRDTMNEAVKVLVAAALFIGYAILAHWSHSDRMVVQNGTGLSVSQTQSADV